MTPKTYAPEQVSLLKTLPDINDALEYEARLKDLGIPAYYATSMGRVMLASIVKDPSNDPSGMTIDWYQKTCTREDDTRCQAGHVESNLRSRLNHGRQATATDRSENISELYKAYYGFLSNVQTTCLLLDRRYLKFFKTDNPEKKGIRSIQCLDAVDLSKYNAREGTKLCTSYSYAQEQVPDTNIFGSGFFIRHDRVLTAAHVLDEAFAAGIAPTDLYIIRGHFVWDSHLQEIKVRKDKIYVLDQEKIHIQSQIRNSAEEGDMAWIRVRPVFKKTPFELHFNGFAPAPIEKGSAVYALGHGLGVPSKLSYNGYVQDAIYAQHPSMFTCDMNILPGSSGSPIFDANTHQLVGIVSGLHEVFTDVTVENDCAHLRINMSGDFSGIATHTAPFRSLP